MRIQFGVNGAPVAVDAEPRTSLLDVLRREVGATGTHTGCEHGVCGCCNVMVDGRTVRSCLMLAVQARGREVTTVEGLAAPDGTLTPLQEAFQRHHAMQCGYCTSGILIGLTAFLRDNPKPTREEVQDSLSANLCRCTGYQQILDAVDDLVADPQGLESEEEAADE
ncbi:(2Fe-2S)-binding protein [Nocardioides humi]|uniref:(2Fe-2S)-binding protein n=1 Tax=Nocardioides humi TaxID=449461 RepID=A0ABN2A7D5_9ACTN|nr:(2Fe-2S)-binding protein [Nocardioides humi]